VAGVAGALTTTLAVAIPASILTLLVSGAWFTFRDKPWRKAVQVGLMPVTTGLLMASAGLPGMAGFISEFLVFRGSIGVFPLATLLCMVGSGLTAVYFLLLVNRAYFGRIAITPPSDDPSADARLDIRLAGVALRETLPALGISLAVVGLGLIPAGLGWLSETTATAMAELPALLQASSLGGLG
jgi:NAD(P)H-quinone oxidoreductase subunit 4